MLAGAADIQRTWLLVIEKGVADGSFRSDIAPRVFYRLIRDAVWLSGRWHDPADNGRDRISAAPAAAHRALAISGRNSLTAFWLIGSASASRSGLGRSRWSARSP